MTPVQRKAAAYFEASARDGTRIEGTRYDGDRSGARLVLVHSLAMDRTFWDALIDCLPAEMSIVAYDCRGHGASDKPAGPYAIETFGDDVTAVLDHVQWPSALVAGASMGGCVAMAFAQRHPARAQGVGLIDTTAWYGADAVSAWEGRAQKAEREGLSALIDFQVTRWFTESFRDANPAAVEACIKAFLANDIPAYAAVCRMLGAADLRAGLAAMRMPVSVIVGDEDYATPIAMAEAMQKAIPGATLRVLPQARHLTPVESPDRVAAELIGLVQRTHTDAHS